MITAFSKFPLRPDLDRETALEEIKETINWYKDRPGLIRKYICLNWEERFGYGVYLWEDRERAEAFYAEALPIIKAQTGGTPEIQFFDCPIVVDNLTGETIESDAEGKTLEAA